MWIRALGDEIVNEHFIVAIRVAYGMVAAGHLRFEVIARGHDGREFLLGTFSDEIEAKRCLDKFHKMLDKREASW